jgi:uncharacterized protein (TIGR02588 family)
VPYEPMSGDDDRTDGQGGAAGDDGGRRATRAERVLGAFGVLLVVGLLGFLTYQAVAERASAPDLSATVSGVERVGEQWAVRFTVDNDGGATAQHVQVLGEIASGGGTTARSATTIDYLPPHSDRDGTLLFDSNPDEGTLSVRVGGYVQE